MAEIKIEKKATVWPWILLIVGILALLYYFFLYEGSLVDTDNTDTEMVEEGAAYDSENNNTTEVSDDASTKIADYKAFISEDANMGADHNYANGALTKLIDATQAVASAANVDIDADLEAARTAANEITDNASKLNHADKIKQAGTSIVQGLRNIQTQKFQNLSGDLTAVQNSLDKIDPKTATLNQKEAVKSFFDQAATLLTNMKNQ